MIDVSEEKVLCKGKIEKMGEPISKFSYKTFSGTSIKRDLKSINSYDDAFEYIKNIILDEQIGVIKEVSEIFAVGHRVVHGGEFFKGPAIISEDVINKIESLIPLAPLHNNSNLSGIKSCIKLLGNDVPQVAVFDTSYYSDIPDYAYMYPIPYEYYKKHNIRKYGFHGTSHQYVSERYAKLVNKNLSDLKIISCHLGNGSSITAIKGGKAVDTSMGLTPLGGIMMGTRSGSLDPSVVFQIAQKESLSIEEMNKILHKDSGLKAIAGIGTSDDRDIVKAEEEGNKRAELAHKMMVYQIVQYIGGYIAILGGCDALIFTGGIGENQWIHRERICDYFSFMGLKLNKVKNKETILGKEGKVSLDSSKIDVFVIPTNEELEIANMTIQLINKTQTERG